MTLTVTSIYGFTANGAAREGIESQLDGVGCGHFHRDEMTALKCGAKRGLAAKKAEHARLVREHSPAAVEARLAEQLDAAGMGAMLVQDTDEHGTRIVAVCTDPGSATPWLRANTNGRANAGALAHLSSAMPNLRVVDVDLEAGR